MLCHAKNELRIERGTLCDGLWKNGATVLHNAVNTLDNGDNGNAEARAVGGILLDGAHSLPILCGAIRKGFKTAKGHTVGVVVAQLG